MIHALNNVKIFNRFNDLQEFFMKEIIDLFVHLKKQTQAIANGINNFISALPVLTQQQINTVAERKLQSSRQEFLDNTDVYYTKDYALVVEIDESSWLANAIEEGISGFDMKEGLLKSPKSKVSKKGFRYIRVPISKNPSWSSGTAKGQEYQKKINDALKNPNFLLSSWQTQASGEVTEYQKLQTFDKSMSGFYRTRTYKSEKDIKTTKPKWDYVMFRTVSSKSRPGSWQHPGIEQKRVLREIEQWLNQSVDILLENFIQSELDKSDWR